MKNRTVPFIYDSFLFEQLLTDDQDIIDLLNAYAVDSIPEDAKTRREKLLEIMEDLGQTNFISTVLSFAKKQAMMCKDVFDFCEKKGVPISGQIQIKTDDFFIENSSLNTNWIFGGKAILDPEIDEKANILANTIIGFADRLKKGEFILTISESNLTEFGEAIKNHPIYSEIFRDEMYRNSEREAVLESDLAYLNRISEEITQIGNRLNDIQIPAGIANAVSEIETIINTILHNISSLHLEPGSSPNISLASIVNEMQIVIREVMRLSEDLTEGQRVKEGLGDFVRSEFWRHRWRIYELWVLITVFGALESIGGKVELLGTGKGVWTLKYGKAQEPVASCLFLNRFLYIYYQLYQKNTEKADMPDIVIKDEEGNSIIVIDPKHGYSYTRNKLYDILLRYSKAFNPVLTAIVNYFPVSFYDYECIDTKH